MVSGNAKRNIKYGHIQIQLSAVKKFKDRMRPGETQTDTILRLIEQDIEIENRKRPNMANSGVIMT